MWIHSLVRRLSRSEFRRWIEHHLECLKVLRNNHLHLRVSSYQLPHSIRIEPLYTLIPVNLCVKPRLYDEWRGSNRVLGPSFEGILNLESRLNVRIECGDQFLEPKVRKQSIFLV